MKKCWLIILAVLAVVAYTALTVAVHRHLSTEPHKTQRVDHSICDSPDWPEPVCDDKTIQDYIGNGG